MNLVTRFKTTFQFPSLMPWENNFLFSHQMTFKCCCIYSNKKKEGIEMIFNLIFVTRLYARLLSWEDSLLKMNFLAFFLCVSSRQQNSAHRKRLIKKWFESFFLCRKKKFGVVGSSSIHDHQIWNKPNKMKKRKVKGKHAILPPKNFIF